MKEIVGQFRGLLSPESEGKLGEVVEVLVDSKSKIIEALDQPVGKYGAMLVDNLLGDKVANQEVMEGLANDFVDSLHDLIVNKNHEASHDVVDKGVAIIKAVVPAEKLIGQEGEDLAGMALTSVIKFILDEYVLKQKE